MWVEQKKERMKEGCDVYDDDDDDLYVCEILTLITHILQHIPLHQWVRRKRKKKRGKKYQGTKYVRICYVRLLLAETNLIFISENALYSILHRIGWSGAGNLAMEDIADPPCYRSFYIISPTMIWEVVTTSSDFVRNNSQIFRKRHQTEKHN
jgi:hypothetical protein